MINVPAHLSAKTPEELRRIMQANNARHGRQFHYFDFQFVRGRWYCWFEISEVDKADKDESQERQR